MKKLILITLVLTITLGVSSRAASPATFGYVPFDDHGTYAPTPILFSNNDSTRTIDFFGGYHYFSADTYFLGTGSTREINAENDSLKLGDVQNNFNGTLVTIKDSDHSITLKGDAYLPLIPNCSRLATDANGKIICGE